MDYTDSDCQKQLIKTFVNSVFVYDDKVVLTFNYSRDDRTITLMEIDSGLQQGVLLPRALCHHKKDSRKAVSFRCCGCSVYYSAKYRKEMYIPPLLTLPLEDTLFSYL